MSKQDLEAKLTRLSSFSTPPPAVVDDALAAYAARVADLEAEAEKLLKKVVAEVAFQYSIRDQEREERNRQHDRHRDEKRRLVQELGFAAVVYDRVMNADWQGRKTIKIESLLEGRPNEQEAA